MRPSRFVAMTTLTIVGLGFAASKIRSLRQLPGVGRLG